MFIDQSRLASPCPEINLARRIYGRLILQLGGYDDGGRGRKPGTREKGRRSPVQKNARILMKNMVWQEGVEQAVNQSREQCSGLIADFFDNFN